jgi:hypothetical protein
MVRERGCTEVTVLEADHAPFLSATEELAFVFARLAGALGTLQGRPRPSAADRAH